MSKPFHERRRQQFLTELFYAHRVQFKTTACQEFAQGLARGENTSDDMRRLTRAIANDKYELLSLRYTGGESILSLRAELSEVIGSYEAFQMALATHEEIPEVAPLGLGNIGHYERCVQLIGLCYLLHRRDLLPRIAALEDPGYLGEDALYEDLLCYELPARVETDKMLHLDPYDPLLGAMYDETDEECVVDIQEYVQGWYPAFKHVPWHDGHLRIDGTEGDYFGYWAFEAGAVAYLLELDDSSISHMVYPKDLVAWARANKHLSGQAADGDAQHGRCDAGQPCPRAGFWFTPAQAGSRRYFKQGEVMPEVGGDYGATIWQWDQNQAPPKL